ncbi:protein regulator of cytokinesis 1-like [Drosophila albomicans]|uniref:Protein regulator of cytokinesis 1-like n=1 Tax=Drosophila albomicans TaxID=7291 RepID=A0A6P8Z1T2_DROAB|nr:protein regulator of cytokinesis 1-like [Drosophila albomicans]
MKMDEAMLQVKAAILAATSKDVDLLNKKWSQMFDEEYCQELILKLEERVRNFYMDLLTESDEKEKCILDAIDALKVEASEINRLMHRNVDIGERPEDMPLIVWEQKLDKSIEHLREELQARRNEICELLLQQEELCEELGEQPLPLLADPLPKPQEMCAFAEHLERLRAEKTRRMEELFKLRSEIKADMKVLQLLPLTAADERLLSQANQCLTPKMLEKLRVMRAEMAAQVVELHERIDDMREKVEVLWERLQETDEVTMQRVRKATKYSQITYDVLSAELQRCQKLRRQNLKTFIEQLRLEISKWWDLTLKSEQERKRFSNYYNDWYNEDLLELHELELDDLKSFYNDNKEIFELFASRAEIWTRMVALEAKANEPNRFNNRGGQLLKEERERKAISSKLPKIEQQISDLVQAYELRTRSPFLVHGENILEHMANEWVRLRQAKEQQSSARKQQVTSTKMLPPPTPGAVASRTPLGHKNMSALSASTQSLRKTPSNWKLASITNSASKTTGNLHKRKLANGDANSKQETPTAKRSLMGALNTVHHRASPALRKPSQRILAAQQKTTKSPLMKVRVMEQTMRRSSGLGRRSMGHATKQHKKASAASKLPARVQSEKENDDADDDDYTTDESSNVATGGHEDIGNYKMFAPAMRSSELPHALRARKQLQLPRRCNNNATNKNKHNLKLAKTEATKPEKQIEAEKHQLQLPEPRLSRMWQAK